MQALPASPVAPDEAIPPRVKDKSPYRHMMAHRMNRMPQDKRDVQMNVWVWVKNIIGLLTSATRSCTVPILPHKLWDNTP